VVDSRLAAEDENKEEETILRDEAVVEDLLSKLIAFHSSVP
jgi:hypothetical protein